MLYKVLIKLNGSVYLIVMISVVENTKVSTSY